MLQFVFHFINETFIIERPVSSIYIYIYIDKYPVLNHINRVLNTVVERVEKKKRQT